MGHFSGTTNPKALGNKGFFSGAAVVAAAPPPSGLVILAGAGSVGGFSALITGYNGNATVVGPGLTGSIVSTGPAGPSPGDLGIGDGNWGGYGGIALVPPYFGVSSGSIFNQNSFTSVTINGHTYVTAVADFFSNGGGCGPTLIAWVTPAGLVIGQQYPIVFV